jgi:hypothetical protein
VINKGLAWGEVFHYEVASYQRRKVVVTRKGNFAARRKIDQDVPQFGSIPNSGHL